MRASDPSLERYLADIRRMERIDESQEQDLLAEAKAGSLSARNRLIKAHLRFVLQVALHYRTVPLPVPDLINEGVLGLVRAIDSYEKRGIKFLSYAVWWIRSTMVRAIEDRGAVIRLSANEHARLRQEKRTRAAGEDSGVAPLGAVRAFSPGLQPGKQEGEDWQDPSPLADELLSGRRLENQMQSLVSTLPEKEGSLHQNFTFIRVLLEARRIVHE